MGFFSFLCVTQRTSLFVTIYPHRLHGTPPPFPFGRICFVVLVMRKGGESS